MDAEIFCEFGSDDFKTRIKLLQTHGIDVGLVPPEVQDLLFYKAYTEDTLWYLLSSLDAHSFSLEDIYSFLRDAELDADCDDVLDSYASADETFLEQLRESAYYSFAEKEWKNEMIVQDECKEELEKPILTRFKTE